MWHVARRPLTISIGRDNSLSYGLPPSPRSSSGVARTGFQSAEKHGKASDQASQVCARYRGAKGGRMGIWAQHTCDEMLLAPAAFSALGARAPPPGPPPAPRPPQPGMVRRCHPLAAPPTPPRQRMPPAPGAPQRRTDATAAADASPAGPRQPHPAAAPPSRRAASSSWRRCWSPAAAGN